MSGKTSYAILISFMTLFAIAAQAKEETKLPDDSKGMIQRRPAKGRPIGTPFAIGKPPKSAPKDAIVSQLDSQIQGLYADCLKTGPKECCEPLIDIRAAMPS